LWNASRCLENLQTHRLEGSIDAFRVNCVAIVDHESVRLIAGNNHSKLLRSPVRRWMRCHVPMQNPSTAHFHDDKHVDHAECPRHDEKEVTGEHRSCVVSHEGAARLCALRCARWSGRHVPSDRPRRHSNAQLQEKFRRQSVPRPTSDSPTPSSQSAAAPPLESAVGPVRAISTQNNRKPFRCHRILGSLGIEFLVASAQPSITADLALARSPLSNVTSFSCPTVAKAAR
jgi:hypothetical protein